MNRIDDLITRAKQLVRPGLEMYFAFVERNGDSWTAQVHLSDGTGKHTSTIQRTVYATMEAAVEHVHAMSREYPNRYSPDVPVIIDDLG